jgi:hypothetical protein
MEEEKFGIISHGNSEMLFAPIGKSAQQKSKHMFGSELVSKKEEKKTWGIQTLASLYFQNKRRMTRKI